MNWHRDKENDNITEHFTSDLYGLNHKIICMFVVLGILAILVWLANKQFHFIDTSYPKNVCHRFCNVIW